jgi:hypothetical protein
MTYLSQVVASVYHTQRRIQVPLQAHEIMNQGPMSTNAVFRDAAWDGIEYWSYVKEYWFNVREKWFWPSRVSVMVLYSNGYGVRE